MKGKQVERIKKKSRLFVQKADKIRVGTRHRFGSKNEIEMAVDNIRKRCSRRSDVEHLIPDQSVWAITPQALGSLEYSGLLG
jgi:hypothetical protein